MFSATPPPKRKTDQRVLNVEFVTVTNLQLPNSAQASSWQWMSQSVTWTYWQADEMEAVVVVVDAAVDVDPREPAESALHDPQGMERAVLEE